MNPKCQCGYEVCELCEVAPDVRECGWCGLRYVCARGEWLCYETDDIDPETETNDAEVE